MKTIFFFLILLSGFTAFSSTQTRDTIPATEAAKHAGKIVTVCGTVVQTLLAFKQEGKPLLLLFEKQIPNQPFTVVIPDKFKEKFAVRPGKYYKQKKVFVTGKIEMVKKKAQMVITNQNAIQIAEREQQ
ncbi:MAG: hypothetical protein J7L95_03595 [Prolixibacteraceae bacterium]|nr:hypothetical protein [Prolixibacteraceae bacterium]